MRLLKIGDTKFLFKTTQRRFGFFTVLSYGDMGMTSLGADGRLLGENLRFVIHYNFPFFPTKLYRQLNLYFPVYLLTALSFNEEDIRKTIVYSERTETIKEFTFRNPMIAIRCDRPEYLFDLLEKFRKEHNYRTLYLFKEKLYVIK